MPIERHYYVHLNFSGHVWLDVRFDALQSLGPSIQPNLIGGELFGNVHLPGKIIAVHSLARSVKGVDLRALADSLDVPLLLPAPRDPDPKPKPEPYEQESF